MLCLNTITYGYLYDIVERILESINIKYSDITIYLATKSDLEEESIEVIAPGMLFAKNISVEKKYTEYLYQFSLYKTNKDNVYAMVISELDKLAELIRYYHIIKVEGV